MRELRNEFGDEPEELAAVDLAGATPGSGTAVAARLAREEEERREYEEAHFIRLQRTKKEKAAQRRLGAGALDQLEQLDDITPLLRDGAAAAFAAGIDVKKLGRGESSSAKRGRAAADDDDDDDGGLDDFDGLPGGLGGLRGAGEGDEFDDGGEAAAFYEETARAAKSRKRAKADAREVSSVCGRAATRARRGARTCAHAPLRRAAPPTRLCARPARRRR